MMKTGNYKAFVAALAGAALISGARAVVTVNPGDLVLGFRAAGGTGGNLDLMVNLGPASTYYNSAPGSAFPVTALTVNDLLGTYGNDWNTRGGITWGIAGTTGAAAVGTAPARTIWASRPEVTPGTMTSPWPTGGVFTLQIPSNTIATMYSGAPGSLNDKPGVGHVGGVGGSSTAAAILDTEAGSWTVQEDFTPGVSFRYFNPTVSGSLDFPAAPAVYDGTGYTVLDLFDVRPGAAGAPSSYVGSFGLNNLGGLVFSRDAGVFAAVPEPSVTMISLVTLVAAAARRRRAAVH